MKDFLITLCLGWLGVHRFMQKKYITGAIWFFTLGLCGIGWAADTLIALVKVANEKKPQAMQQTTQNPKNEQKFGGGVQPTGKRFIKSFDTVIVGTFAKCSLDPDEKREDVIMRIRKNSSLDLEFWEYKGEPAYYVTYNCVDAGNLRAGLAKILYEEYKDCELKVTAIDRTMDDKNDCLTYNIRIDIYK